MKLSSFSINRPKFTIVIMLVLLILGLVSLTRLPLQLFPDVEAPVAAVATSYEGAGPEEVVNDVTEVLEEDLSTISGLNDMTSQSSEGSSIVILEFDWDTSISDVETEIVSTITQSDLPEDAGQPSFIEFDPSMFPSMQIAVSSDGDDVIDFQDDVFDMQRELSRIDGVADLSESGSMTELYEVELNQEEVNDAGVSQEDIVETIQSHDIAVPGGVIQDGERNISTRVLSELTSQEDIEELVVGQDPETGEQTTIADVATVSFTVEDEDVITRVNQEAAIQLDLMQESDANTTQVTQDFEEELAELQEDEPYDDLSVVTLYSEGEYIQDAIDSVMLALVGGGVLAMLVLFFFLRNVKTPLIIGIAIPFSIIVTFALFFFTDVTLNMMTLGGLALGIGMLVDNSIVVIENIYRHLSMRKPAKQAAFEGTKEVASAITASTLTTVSVFLPIVFVTGLVGDLFAPLAIAVSFSLFASLFVALTVVPMIASRILTAPEENIEEKRRNSRFIKIVESGVKWALGRRVVVILLTLLLLGGGAAGLTTAGVEFIPDSDEGTFIVEVEHDHGTSLDVTQETVEEIEDELDDHSEVEHYLSTVGSSAMEGGISDESHIAEIMVNMVPGSDRDVTTTEFTETIESDIENIDDNAEINVSVMAQAGMGEPNTFAFSINDPNRDRLQETTDDLVEELEDESVIRNVDTSVEDTAPELQVLVDEEAAQDEGLVPAQIAQTVNEKTSGQVATTIQTNDNSLYQVNVAFDDELTESVENYESITIENQAGEHIPLSDVAEIEEGEGPATIDRADMIPSIDFDVVYTSSSNLGEVSALVDDIVEDYELDDEAEYVVGGDRELLDDAMENMALAFGLGLIFIYLVMAAQFESFKYPFVIMFSVPLFVIGVMLALTLTQTPISVIALIGVIVLAGIVVNNAIVLVDYTNQKKEQGMRSYDAMVEAVKDRARPILITALTTILGVTPLALAIGEGTEIQQPMGIVVIGGLISSTFLTLFVIPVIYSLFDRETRNMNKKYMTPDGEVIYARDLPQNSRLKEGREDEVIIEPTEEFTEQELALEKEKQAQRNEDSASDKTQADEQTTKETKEDLSTEEIVDLLEEVVRRSRKSKKSDQEREEE
ncbi:efflux RND transporter permease subunit [Salsuginibacillus kocurii]|uniref:efflux RND transporter permease subunit n=1 Tax=Salsuginibacillus kocurii TaxID=427078 RepID=UPI000374286E|nr:efflux RND transporter permease subunit [Salsuginibacillus kocurii]